jgi:signal transduction histidine kinase/ActR/RegA family two-component response regulator
MPLLRILHIDGNRPYAESFQRHMKQLAAHAGTTFVFDTVDLYEDAANLLRVRRYDVVVSDVEVSGGGALQLLSEQLLELPPVIVLAHEGSELLARNALKAGAHDYFPASGDVTAYKAVFDSIISLSGTVSRVQPSRDGVLAQTAYEFLSLPDGTSLFNLIGSHLSRLWPGGCTIVFSHTQHHGTFVIEDVQGPADAIKALGELFGMPLCGNECCIDTTLLPLHGTPRLMPVGAPLATLLCGMVPDELAASLSARLGVSQVYSYPFSCDDGLHGLAVLVQVRGSAQPDTELIEGYFRLARTAIRRRCMELRLRKQRNELSTFAHTLSHEIRNDLTAIRGFVSLMEGNENEQFKARILEKVGDLSAFVAQSVTLADAGAVVGKAEYVDMNALVDGIAKSVLPDTIAYSRTSLPPIRADPQRMAQVVRNLLQNVVDHAVAGSVSVSGSRANGTCRYVVADDGRGIAGDPGEIFSWGVTSSAEGSGMGLAIVLRIAQAMGGTAYVASTSEKGTQMAVAIPCGE